MKTKKYIYTFIAFAFFAITSFAQTNDDVLNLLIQKKAISQEDADSLRADAAVKEQEAPKDKTFTIGGELRTRTEYRHGYRNLVPKGDTANPAYFTNQRARISFTYEQKNRFKLHTSIQDVRVWGQTDPRSNSATLQLYEAYGQIFLKPKFSIKLGQQVFSLDDQRLFAENDWRVNGQTHDAVNFIFEGDKVSSQLLFAENQTSSNNGVVNQPNGEPLFNTTYVPAGGVNSTYKALGVHYLKYKITDSWTLTTINSADGYQRANSKNGTNFRYTDGGRLAYEKGRFYATYSGYWQSGLDASGNLLDAFYHQAEVKYTIPESFTVRLGAEVMSGGNAKYTNTTTDHNFSPLYGVAHRFNGNMDFFTSFPADVNNAGLINPYLFFTKTAGKKITFRSDFHLFYSENEFYSVVKNKAGKVTSLVPNAQYLGYENDLGFIYKPQPYITIDFGWSYAVVDPSMGVIKKAGSTDRNPTWAYISVSLKPQLFKTAFK